MYETTGSDLSLPEQISHPKWELYMKSECIPKTRNGHKD